MLSYTKIYSLNLQKIKSFSSNRFWKNDKSQTKNNMAIHFVALKLDLFVQVIGDVIKRSADDCRLKLSIEIYFYTFELISSFHLLNLKINSIIFILNPNLHMNFWYCLLSNQNLSCLEKHLRSITNVRIEIILFPGGVFNLWRSSSVNESLNSESAQR